MNIYALLLLCSLSTAIAMPFDPDFQLEDPNPPTMLLASDPVSGIPNPLGLNQYTSPGDANPPSPDTSSPTPDSPPQYNDNQPPPVAESAVGEDFCCEPKRGAEKQVCHKVVGSFNSMCFPNDVYNCPNGYKDNLNGCTKLPMDARKQPSWPSPLDFIWLGGICFKKPRPPLCPGFFDNFGGFRGL